MKHTKESIQALLETSDKALVRGLMVIFALQTASEKESHMTREHNGVGFSPFHAEFLSSLAHQVQRGRSLSPKQTAALRKTMRRYAGQLAKVANGKITNPLGAPVAKTVTNVPAEPPVTTPDQTGVRDKILADALAVTTPVAIRPPLVW